MYGDFITDMVKVNMYYGEIEDYYIALQNPTDEFKKCYEAMEDMYDVYLEFYSIAKNPSGSLITYTQSFNEKDTEFMNSYNKYKELVPLQESD